MCWQFLESPMKILAPMSALPPTNRAKWKPSSDLKYMVSVWSAQQNWVLVMFISYITYALSEKVMPYFSQEPISYLTLPTIKNAYKAFSIKINFRPDNVDGKSLINLPFFSAFDLCFWYFIECNLCGSLILPSFPHLTPPVCGGKVSCCMQVSLRKWKLLSGCIWLPHCAHSWLMDSERSAQNNAWAMFSVMFTNSSRESNINLCMVHSFIFPFQNKRNNLVIFLN